MKKIYLFLMLFAATALNAQVAFLKLEETYSAEADGGQCPELTAYNWFNENYVTNHTLGTGSFIKLSDFSTADLSGYSVIWLAIGRSLADKEALLTLFNETNRNKLKAYIEAGGNVFLSGHASYLSHSIGRVTEDLNTCGWNSAYVTGGDDWSVRINSSGHKIWSAFVAHNVTPGSRQEGTWYEYKLVGHHRNDRNCLWTGKNWSDFQTNQNCKIHGFWGNDGDPNGAGLVEFYPKGGFKGTIIVDGLAAYQWGKDNTYLNHVKYLTQGILDYLSKRATATWETAPKANPVIKDEENVIVTPGTNCTVTVATSDPNIANYNEGHIYYNFFGNVTFTATATGDGVNIPKNAVLYPEVRTVTGGESDAGYGYVLPYSLKALKEYTGADATLGYPDYLAAKWFYDHYIDPNRTAENNYGNGRFVAKDDIPADNSVMKVLWFNMDRAGYAENDFENEFINTDFRTNLTTYVTNGGNIFLTKQTCRLSKDMGRAYWYPVRFANGGISNNSDDWYITANFRLSEQDVDQSKHAAFKYMGDPTTEAGGYGWKMLSTGADQRTDNNTVWEDWGVYGTSAGSTDMGRLTVFEEGMHNCRILAGFGHTRALDAAGMVELLPYGSFNGTIIALGLSAYQWTSTNTAIANVQNLTKGVLQYLFFIDPRVPGCDNCFYYIPE